MSTLKMVGILELDALKLEFVSTNLHKEHFS